MSGSYWLFAPSGVPVPTPGAADIEAALSGQRGAVNLAYRFQQRDHSFAFMADLTDAIYSASIDLNNTRAIVRTASFSFDPAQAPAGFDPASAHVAVLASLLVPVYVPGGSPPGWYVIPPPPPRWVSVPMLIPMGLYHLDAPRKAYTPDGQVRWAVEASEMVSHLLTAKTPVPYTVLAGTNYITAVEAVIDSLGASLQYAFPSTAAVTPDDFSWPPGTSYWQITSDLLDGINFYRLWSNATGVLTSRERVIPSDETPNVGYSTTAEPRMMVSPWEKLQDHTRYANRIAGVINDPRRTPQFIVLQNADPASPISSAALGVVNVGDEISAGRYVDLPTVADAVAFELNAQAAQSQQGGLSTFLDPRRGPHEFYALTVETVEVGTLWMVGGWKMDLQTGAVMHHDLGLAQAIVLSIVITLSGTILVATEANIVSGGRTIVLTLPDGYQWVAAGAAFDAERQGIIDGLVSAGSEAAGWNATVVPAITVGSVVRSSATVVTITLPAVGGYSITAPETITSSVPATAIVGAAANVTDPQFTITT